MLKTLEGVVVDWLICFRCQEETKHLVVNPGEENCVAICQGCSKVRVW